MEGVLAGRLQIVFMRHANASSVEFRAPNLSQPGTGGGQNPLHQVEICVSTDASDKRYMTETAPSML